MGTQFLILCVICCSVSGSCAHVLAAVYQLEDWLVQGLQDIPDGVSCTSTSQQWHRPRGLKIEPTGVSSMIFAKPLQTRKRRPVIPTFCDNRFNIHSINCTDHLLNHFFKRANIRQIWIVICLTNPILYTIDIYY